MDKWFIRVIVHKLLTVPFELLFKEPEPEPEPEVTEEKPAEVAEGKGENKEEGEEEPEREPTVSCGNFLDNNEEEPGVGGGS